MKVARVYGGKRAQRVGTAAGVIVSVGAAALAGAGAGGPWPAIAAGSPAQAQDITIASPRPFFMQLSGEGPLLAGHTVVWAAINAQGQAGSAADRIYAYDTAHRRLSTPVHTRYGANGFIGGYALSGNELAYVDTGFTPGGLLNWRVSIVDLSSGRAQTVAASSPGMGSRIPPQIAFDGTHLLMLQSVDVGATGHESMATLFTLPQHRSQVVDRVRDLMFGDPALATNTAFWTTISFGAHASSHLTAYDMARRAVTPIPVGDVSQLAASGDLLVWKSGMSGVNGRIGLYSLRSKRVLASNLAGNDRAIFPSINGDTVAWTYADGSRVQVYSLGSGRVIYNAPTVRHRYYGLTAVSSHSASWAYTVIAAGKGAARGYVVVHQIR